MDRDAEAELDLGGDFIDGDVVDEGTSEVNDIEVCVVNEEVALGALAVGEILALGGGGVSGLEVLLVGSALLLWSRLLRLLWRHGILRFLRLNRGSSLGADEAEQGGHSESLSDSSHC